MVYTKLYLMQIGKYFIKLIILYPVYLFYTIENRDAGYETPCFAGPFQDI
ncbi:MAG: hypothetical protein JWO03_2348 [Bacteroidetes bacterium]|nr:hypothetical protein [Bacteroidota bacterium]